MGGHPGWDAGYKGMRIVMRIINAMHPLVSWVCCRRYVSRRLYWRGLEGIGIEGHPYWMGYSGAAVGTYVSALPSEMPDLRMLQLRW